MAAPSATQWGSPTATKRALLIHGITSSSHTWHTVALALVAEGYFVVAPDLLGHGARRADDYRVSISGLAEDLRSYLEPEVHFDLIIGHSMGGATALALLPFLPHSRPISMILVDPGLELSADLTETIRGLCIGGINDARAGKGFELSKAAYPQWKEEDVMWTVLGMYMCDIAAIEEIFRQNRPWSFAHLLGTPHPNISITILIADPSSTGMRIADDIKVYPDIKSVLLPPGTGHWVQYERPEAIVEEALKAVALQRV